MDDQFHVARLLKVLFFVYGFFGGFFVVMYANLKENVDLQIQGTATGYLNTFVFIGGAVFQQVMAAIIAKYPTTAAQLFRLLRLSPLPLLFRGVDRGLGSLCNSERKSALS